MANALYNSKTIGTAGQVTAARKQSRLDASAAPKTGFGALQMPGPGSMTETEANAARNAMGPDQHAAGAATINSALEHLKGN